MKNFIALIVGVFVFSAFAIVGISTQVRVNNSNIVSKGAEVLSEVTSVETPFPNYQPPITVAPTAYILKERTHVYITYTCKNDTQHYSYISQISSLCRHSYDLLKEANYSCNTKTGSGVETYIFSPPCAAPRLTPTPSITYVSIVPCAMPTAPYCPNGRLVASANPQTPGVCPPKYICVVTPTPSLQCQGKPDGTICYGGCINITCLPGNICPACPVYKGTCQNQLCVQSR